MIVLFGVVLCKSFLPERILDNIGAYIIYPVLLAQTKIVQPIKCYFDKKYTNEQLYALLKKMQSDHDALLADNIQLQAMLSHINQTQELLDFKKQFDLGDAQLSQVLVKHFSDQAHYFLIDKGLNAGVQPDMVAIYKNCLLGKVVEVYPFYSKVLLITDRNCKVASYCVHTKASGIHAGCNQGRTSGLQYVTHLADIDPGDLVLSSGDGLVFPKGFALGKVKTCKPEGLFYDVSIELLCDMHQVDYCFIVQKGYKQSSLPALIACSEQAAQTLSPQLQSVYLVEIKKVEQLSGDSSTLTVICNEQSKNVESIVRIPYAPVTY
jgi:rod shape-determining protein MreC